MFATSSGSVTDAQVRDRIEPMLAKVAALPHVSRVASPYSAQGQPQVSADRRVAFATVTYDVAANKIRSGQAKQLVNDAESAGRDGLRVPVSGQLAMRASPPSLGGAYIGLLAAAVVLLITFGSLFSMLLPVLTAAVPVRHRDRLQRGRAADHARGLDAAAGAAAAVRPAGAVAAGRRRLAEGGPREQREGRAWGRWARAIIGRPVGATLASLAVVVLLALPFLAMRLGISDAGLDPAGSTTRISYDRPDAGTAAGAGAEPEPAAIRG